MDNLKTKIFEMIGEGERERSKSWARERERERKRGSENLASMWVAREENRRL